MERRIHEDARNRPDPTGKGPIRGADRLARGRFEFGALTIDLGQRRVRRGNDNLAMPKLSFDLLATLVQAAPDSLSTDELMNRVWAGAVVSPATVAKRVELLRQALGDDSHEPRYVALVRGHGYRLIPAVRAIPSAKDKARHARLIVAATVAVVAVAVGAWLLFSPAAPPPEKSIAVLPFVAMSDDSADQVFADGLTDELSLELSRNGDLKVTGRTSSFYFQGRNEDLRVIGETLGVAHLLEGSVRRSGDRLRITAQLIATANGFHLWSGSYDRQMDAVFDIQKDIAVNVAASLRSTLSAGAGSDRERRRSPHPEAYALYLRAVSLSPYGAGKNLADAQRLIERAVVIDPEFAPAWNRLAAVHGRRLFFRDPGYGTSAPDALRIMHNAVEKALALDANSGEAYANLGGMAWVFDGDAAKAAPLIEKALALDPWNLDVVAFAAEFAKFIGRLDESLILEEQLVERDPLCESCRYRLARSYLFNKRFDEAVHELQTLRAINGKGYLWNLGVAHLLRGNAQDALEAFEAMEAEGDYRHYLHMQGKAMALHALGRREESNALLAAFVDRFQDDQPLDVAQGLGYVARIDDALAVLQQSLPASAIALQVRYPSPLFDNLRQDPRWDAILQQVGRSPEQVAQIPFTLNTRLN